MALGRFVWFDLLTTDLDAGRAFYSDVVGWKLQKWDGPNDYTMFVYGEGGPVGGSMALPEEAAAKGMPPMWVGFVEVADVDATIAQALELGGAVLNPAFDMPTVGRIATIADPQGAAIAVFKPEGEMSSDKPGDGDVGWCELNTKGWQAAFDFYAALFGWIVSMDMDMGGANYRMFKVEGMENSIGGMFDLPAEVPAPPHWLYYITVPDLDASLERVKAGGGQVMNGPMDVPGGDKVA
jgi:uncharacterized protein